MEIPLIHLLSKDDFSKQSTDVTLKRFLNAEITAVAEKKARLFKKMFFIIRAATPMSHLSAHTRNLSL
jgi:hypothetical protein